MWNKKGLHWFGRPSIYGFILPYAGITQIRLKGRQEFPVLSAQLPELPLLRYFIDYNIWILLIKSILLSFKSYFGNVTYSICLLVSYGFNLMYHHFCTTLKRLGINSWFFPSLLHMAVWSDGFFFFGQNNPDPVGSFNTG